MEPSHRHLCAHFPRQSPCSVALSFQPGCGGAQYHEPEGSVGVGVFRLWSSDVQLELPEGATEGSVDVPFEVELTFHPNQDRKSVV